MSEAIALRFSLAHAGFAMQLDLALPAQGVTALFGRSGSGKTSSLRVIAGLQAARDVFVSVAGVVWQDDAKGIVVPPHQRALGYVFQEPSLFGHLSVRGNLEYGFKRVPPAQRRLGFEQVVALLGIAPLLARRPQGLSGGERQRVAIARALLTSPRLLLMDEPLAALDAQSRAEILPWLERLHGELDMPLVYVSHAMDEVARLADHLVLFEAGRVLASGPLQDMLTRLDLPIANADDSGAVLQATVLSVDRDYGLSQLDCGGVRLWAAAAGHAPGERLRARVLARDVSLATSLPGPSSILNVLPARIIEIHDEGADKVNVRLAIGDPATGLLARITRRSCDSLALRPGMAVYAQIKGVALLA